jgi:hypothetical protein
MPWRGKAFAAGSAQGRNRFVAGARRPFRVLWPGLDDRPDGDGGFTAFAFDTTIGPSATHPETAVLRLDYARPSSPWPVRLVLDELVEVGDGQHLGQALVWWRGRRRRAAWFALEPPR